MPTLPDLKAAAGAIGRGTRDRLAARHPARRRRHHRVVCRLHPRKACLEEPGAVRPRRHRGRCGAGKRQQRGGADLVHSAAHPRHPAEPGDGADGRRHDHPRHRAGPAGHDQAAGAVLGHDRLDVDRQPDADRHQPAAGRHVGAAAARAVPPSVPDDRHLLLHRRLFAEQRAVRRVDDGDLRRRRLLAGEARLRAGADDPGLRAWTADGGKPPPRHADRPRRRLGVPDAADLGDPAGDRAVPAGAGGAAVLARPSAKRCSPNSAGPGPGKLVQKGAADAAPFHFGDLYRRRRRRGPGFAAKGCGARLAGGVQLAVAEFEGGRCGNISN